MKKEIHRGNVHYTIDWSPHTDYDKFRVRGLPDTPGIVELFHRHAPGSLESLIFLDCWREGLRTGIAMFMDPLVPRLEDIRTQICDLDLVYRFCPVETSPRDLKDILHWLIRTYKPKYNNHEYSCSRRYDAIAVTETERS